MKSRHLSRLLRLAGALAIVAALCHAAIAADDYQRFLDALRDRGYYDVAVEYLGRLRSDPQIPQEFKGRIAYEEGVTLIAASRAERDADQKAKHLNAASAKLNEFIKSAGDPAVVAEAESQLGNVLVERAKMLLNRAKLPKYAAQKTALVEEARARFSEAQQVFTSAEQKFAEHLKHLPKSDKPSSAANETREEARVDLRRARLFAAQAVYESSKAYPAESPEQKKLLETAAGKFGELHEKYRTTLLGRLASAYQGRCYLDLGDTKRALGMLSELLRDSDDSPDLRRLKTHALSLAMQAWTSDAEKSYETAAQSAADWINKQPRSADTRSGDWLTIRYYAALALKKQADAAGKSDESRKRQALSEARKHAKEAAAHPGEYQDDAKRLYQELLGAAEGDEKTPTTFADANDRANDALNEMQAKLQQIKLAPSLGDQANVPTYERESHEARDKAKELFRLALNLRDASTPIDDVNAARYFLCYLDYQVGEYDDAAVLGDFLARRHPTYSASRQAAKIALLSYMQAYNAASGDERQSEKARMIRMADFMARRWAGEAEGDEAWMTLMVVATNERDVDQLLGYLAKIPEESPRRAEAELKAGQALWIASLTAARQPEETRPPQAEIDTMRNQAQQTLARGIERLAKSPDVAGVSFTTATGALSLAQIYVEMNQPAEAVKLLEDLKLGPLTLVNAKSPVASEGTFATETYKAALRAYVATQQLDKAEKAMNSLETSVAAGGDEKASQTLIAIYRALGQELENHVASLRKESRTEDLQNVSRGFELFLDRIVNKAQGNNFNSLNWVADTYSRLGAGHGSEDEAPSQQSRSYYEKAALTDETILKSIDSNPAFASPEAALAVKVRLARSQRRSGHYKEAIDLLVDVLKTRPMLLDVQKEAAYTYQEWGRENPATYALAIGGARKAKDAKGQEYNVLWGWNRLAALTQRDKKYQEVFHEARYNLAKCWLLAALQQKDAEKAGSLDKARSAVELTAQLHPDLGGGDWPKKYDELMKRIQRESGQPQTGLPSRKHGDADKPHADTAAVKMNG
jgi:hypothetical protein